ncbi:DNA-directed RNA polymerase subunit K [Candidatus Woesearchaeota archaeon]|nr:MAG: DNA-directed RNA polymerase subunit K [Candidatus Woesearchaeota archaeon]
MREVATDVTTFTKYEKARMIGSRALQISMGAPLALKFKTEELEAMNYNPVEIAKKEFEAGKIPLKVLRDLPMKKSVAREEAAKEESVAEEAAEKVSKEAEV